MDGGSTLCQFSKKRYEYYYGLFYDLLNGFTTELQIYYVKLMAVQKNQISFVFHFVSIKLHSSVSFFPSVLSLSANHIDFLSRIIFLYQMYISIYFLLNFYTILIITIIFDILFLLFCYSI